MSSRNSEVLVLGAGVIGLSCALSLLKRGVGVRVVDRGRPGNGSSHGNCGTITPSHAEPLFMPGMIGQALRWMPRRDAPFHVSPKPDWQRWRWLLGFARRCNWGDFERAARPRADLLQYSRRLLQELIEGDGLACQFEHSGTLYVYRTAKAMEKHAWHAETLQKLGVPVELKSGDEVQAMEPALLPGMAGGEFHPGDAHLRPNQLVSELERRVRELGGIIEEDAEIHAIDRDARKIVAVQTTRGDFSGRHVVMALGAWSPQLGRSLGLRLPMQPGKGYSLTTSRPALCPRRPLTLHEHSVCVTAWPGGFRLGSTMEFSGYSEGVNKTRVDALRRGAKLYLREPWGDELKEEWWGWRPMCVDELPLIGPSSRWDNLHLATAHGMMGVSMSTATGELVAAQITDQTPDIDPAPYLPARWAA